MSKQFYGNDEDVAEQSRAIIVLFIARSFKYGGSFNEMLGDPMVSRLIRLILGQFGMFVRYFL